MKTYASQGVQYFCAKDITRSLGYANQRQAVIQNVFEEDRVTLENIRESTGEPPSKNEQGKSIYLTEAGVYALIFGSKLEQARQFKKWVCQVVLPRLRKSYRPQLHEPLCLKNETALHEKVVDFVRKQYPHALLIAGLGELQTSCDKRIQAWRKGYTAGQPDLILANAHKTWNGLCLEFKTPKGNGKISQKQIECLKDFRRANYKTLVVDEYDKAILNIVEYMQNVRICCPHCSKKFKNQETLDKHLRVFHRIL